ncbi:LysR family transcriptional regulator [Sphingopyxis sp. BSNA05]|uniref:LysR family transcriptional regulator n=1 Tax=Sphingopyxis sp. BSNA05 TaxID=1236614 RepID=UPI001565223C|nr:LysR family transcriptional regulator [Sphingopyxis sp. BSNA05]NRD89332.1 LysR family transcriptional regulator [Sphingopyxis sp. BSNA05]
MQINSHELLTFVTVVDCGQVGLAAQMLGQNPSSISRTLARLEEKLGVTLLARTTRRQQLTEEGIFFLEKSRLVLSEMKSAEDLLKDRDGTPSGRLRVDAASPFMLHCVVPHIPLFCQKYPQIELELTSSEGNIDLIEQRTDVALRIGALKDSGLHARLLGVSQLRLLASPDYMSRRNAPQTVEELDQHDLIGFTRPESLNSWPLKSAKGAQWKVDPRTKASSGETIRQLALHGQGIACLADFMTHEDQRQGRLIPVLDEHTIPVWQEVSAVFYRQTELASRIRVFIDFIVEKAVQSGGMRPTGVGADDSYWSGSHS